MRNADDYYPRVNDERPNPVLTAIKMNLSRDGKGQQQQIPADDRGHGHKKQKRRCSFRSTPSTGPIQSGMPVRTQ